VERAHASRLRERLQARRRFGRFDLPADFGNEIGMLDRNRRLIRCRARPVAGSFGSLRRIKELDVLRFGRRDALLGLQ